MGAPMTLKAKKKKKEPSICQSFPLFPKEDQVGKLIWKVHRFTKEIKCWLLWQPEAGIQQISVSLDLHQGG